MATVPTPSPSPAAAPPELHNGDRMTQQEFHRVYEQLPEGFKAELIGGIVHVSSPMRRRHAVNHPALVTLFFIYARKTPGVETGDNGTVILGEGDEPQPDLFLRILPEYGGRSRTTAEDYVAGPPELVAEIAHSSQAVDLHAKRETYTQHGVTEYVVVSLRDQQIYWFDLTTDNRLTPDAGGVYRSGVLPGLWVNGPAVLALDLDPMVATLQQGLAAPEHAAFVAQLAAARPAP